MSVVPELLASGAVAAVVGGVASWLVARETRQGTVEQAEAAATAAIGQAKIGAEVEHAKRRDARRDQALPHLVAAEEMMGMLKLGAADPKVRAEAAVLAHSEIARAAVILSDTFDSSQLNELLAELLRGGEGFDRAGEIWPDVRRAIVAPRVG